VASTSPVPRRTVVGGAIGLAALTLPTAARASSTTVAGTGTPGTVPEAGSLLFHLDANSYSPGLGHGWNDLSGSGNHGTIGSGVSFVGASGGTPAHFTFDGLNSNSVVSIKNGDAITDPGPTAYTKMLWFRKDTTGSRLDNLMSAATGESHFLYFNYLNPNKNRLLTTGHNGNFTRLVLDTYLTNANEWLFAAARFSTTSGFTLYINTSDTDWAATLVKSSAYNASTDALSTGLTFHIGSFGGTNGLQGKVATALAYNLDIGDSAVKSYFASTVNRFYA
jgi:hypothetical protein